MPESGPAVGYYSLAVWQRRRWPTHDAHLRGGQRKFWAMPCVGCFHAPFIGADAADAMPRCNGRPRLLLMNRGDVTGGLVLLETLRSAASRWPTFARWSAVRATIRIGIDVEFEDVVQPPSQARCLTAPPRALYQPGLVVSSLIMAQP